MRKLKVRTVTARKSLKAARMKSYCRQKLLSAEVPVSSKMPSGSSKLKWTLQCRTHLDREG